MKCKKAIIQIHLLNELTESERNEVLQHVETCLACQKISESVEQLNTLIAIAATTQHAPVNSAALTNRIMTSIKTTQQPTWLERLISLAEAKQVKWSMAVVSLMLIGVLTLEELRPTEVSLAKAVPSASTHRVTILNIKTFRDELQRHKADYQSSLKACQDPFTITQYNTACLREKLSKYKTL